MAMAAWSVAVVITTVLVSLDVVCGQIIPGAENVTTVHFVSSCHLDVGFADTAANILNRYFDHFFKESINVSAALRQRGGEEQLVFLTHPYLVSLYLDCPPGMGIHCPTNDDIDVFEEAVGRGDIVWHAMPFNSQLELLDVGLLDFSIKLTHSLDKQYGKTPTVTMSQRDVPGTTRAIIPTLVDNGVKAITVGVNTYSMPPAVPSAFVWRHSPTNQSVLGMWHPGGYGGQGGVTPDSTVVVPGLSHALVYGFRGDNSGPPTVNEVLRDYAVMRELFPNAEHIVASDLDSFVEHLAEVQDKLPVITKEIGDTWIYGVPSDPVKVAQFREIMRLRADCIRHSECDPMEERFWNFSRLLIKGAEHTWGKNENIFLNDFINWHNKQFYSNLNKPNYINIISSWKEQRDWAIDYPISALEDHLLRQRITEHLAALKGYEPSTDGFTKVSNKSAVFTCGSLEIGFSPATGAITHFLRKTTGMVLAAGDHQLMQLIYQTFTQQDIQSFIAQYHYADPNKYKNIPKAFGKPGVNNTVHQMLNPTLQEIWQRRDLARHEFLLRLTFPDAVIENYGAPVAAWLNVTIPTPETRTIFLEVTIVNKTATRLPESLAVHFNPLVSDAKDMRLNKLGQLLDPRDIVMNGSKHLHGLHTTGGVSYGELQFESLDTSVVSVGQPNPFPVPQDQPAVDDGFSFLISNNLWGTNYIMWFPFLPEDATTKYRMRITLPHGQ